MDPGHTSPVEETSHGQHPQRMVQMESALWVAPDLVGARLVAARPVTWRGRGELCQCPWMRPLRGSWLVIECWAGVGGLALALLSMGGAVLVAFGRM